MKRSDNVTFSYPGRLISRTGGDLLEFLTYAVVSTREKCVLEWQWNQVVGGILPPLRLYLMKQIQSRKKIDDVADILTTLKLLGIESELFNKTLEELPVNLWVHDENYMIVYGNNSFKENYGDFQKQSCHQCLMGEKNICRCCPVMTLLEDEKNKQCKLCRRGNSGYDLNLSHTLITHPNGKKFVLKSGLFIKDFGILAENHFFKKQNRDWENIIIIMCASCKRVRDKDNNWIAVDNHIIDCFNVRISHSLCCECAGILYPTLDIRGLH